MEIFELFGGIGFILFILCLFSDEILVFAIMVIMVIVLGIIGYLIFLLICYWMRKDIEKEERKKMEEYQNRYRSQTYPVPRIRKKEQPEPISDVKDDGNLQLHINKEEKVKKE